jgi:CheY-like chemotaxis protein
VPAASSRTPRAGERQEALLDQQILELCDLSFAPYEAGQLERQVIRWEAIRSTEALSRIPYEVILMDVQMPELDGHEATAEIRRREKEGEGVARRTPIIAMTANAMLGDREKALEVGMDDYVSKPVKAEELDAVLKRWISKPDEEASVSEATDRTAASAEAVYPLDRSVLAGLRELQGEGEPDLLDELIEMFFDDVPSQLEALQEAVEVGDAHSVERVAHTLKGSCGNMGATRMAAICAELQDIGPSKDLSRASRSCWSTSKRSSNASVWR